MNKALQLKGSFGTNPGSGGGGTPVLPAGATVTKKHLMELHAQLDGIIKYWQDRKYLPFNPLVTVHYQRVVAKSNRIMRLLGAPGQDSSNFIVGARFEHSEPQKTVHVITHCVPLDMLKSTSEELSKCICIFENCGAESINSSELRGVTDSKNFKPAADANLGKTIFAQIIRDAYFVSYFAIDSEHDSSVESGMEGSALVSLYDTGLDVLSVMSRLGIRVEPSDRIDDATLLLDAKQYEALKRRAPYLISMSNTNISELKYEDTGNTVEAQLSIPEPNDEPIVGVIDTGFDNNVYFSQWVDYHDLIDPSLRAIHNSDIDNAHGTEVTSLIVDGPQLNKNAVIPLDDGCGRFRVRHFAVAVDGKNSMVSIYKNVSSIVKSNQDIKVWNLSLGSPYAIRKNSISLVGALLDRLQNKYDVIFVVAGTNIDERYGIGTTRIGSPADSINSVVVNATDVLGQPASYTRVGPVLSFFKKPDISCFGGDGIDGMAVYSPNGLRVKAGTSFAAPWITRKLAYLINVMGLSREVAKALLVDAAAGWQPEQKDSLQIGYGIVPQRIEDILQTPDDEIRFMFEGIIDGFETYNYRIPVPLTKDKYQYTARATLCYFPTCNRAQGVDYTDTELDFHFGRVDDKGKVRSLDHNVQGEADTLLYEDDARQMYRKWDNVKHLADMPKIRFTPKKSLGNEFWGFKIRATERSYEKKGRGLHFGIVVTLRDMTHKNRIGEFEQKCWANRWIVRELDAQVMNAIHQEANAEIDFKDKKNG